MRKIPLRNRAKEVVAYALVDDELHSWLSQWTWCLNDGYVIRHVRWWDGDREQRVQQRISMHRQIAGLHHGDPRQVDHEDGDPLNNQRANLRLATSILNGQNRKLNRNSSTGYRGVSRESSGRFRAYANVSKVRHKLGTFDTAQEAAAAVTRFRATHLPYSSDARP